MAFVMLVPKASATADDVFTAILNLQHKTLPAEYGVCNYY